MVMPGLTQLHINYCSIQFFTLWKEERGSELWLPPCPLDDALQRQCSTGRRSSEDPAQKFILYFQHRCFHKPKHTIINKSDALFQQQNGFSIRSPFINPTGGK